MSRGRQWDTFGLCMIYI